MFRKEYSENVGNYLSDLRRALKGSEVAEEEVDTVARRWVELPIGEKLPWLRRLRQPHERYLFAVRNACLPPSGDWVGHWASSAARSHNGKAERRREGAEYFALAAGYIPPTEDTSLLRCLPRNPAVFERDVAIVTERVSRPGWGAKRAHAVQEAVYHIAQECCGTARESLVRDPDVQRVMFRLRLQSALLECGVTELHLEKVEGMDRSTSRGVLRWNRWGQRHRMHQLITTPVVNACLRELPLRSHGVPLAREYFGCWKDFSRFLGDIKPRHIRSEVQRGESQRFRAYVEMLLRAIPIMNPYRVTQAQISDATSSVRVGLSNLLQQEGLARGEKTEQLLRKLIACCQEFDAPVTSARAA